LGIVVQKFGGSSVADTDKLFNVCKHIIKEYDAGNKMIVVVSAQGKTTDNLIAQEAEITDEPNKREHDVLVATGEQITIAKLVMCLNKLGYEAVSFMGWQIPINTDNVHGEARIKSIEAAKLLDNLDNNKIVVVAGFQGIDKDGNITTLGRGGSDTTAVALAAVLKADKCEIYTDVDGVFSADPRAIPNAAKIETITYDEMLELASLGAKVLHNRCVEIGNNFNIPIIVKSTFKEESRGTIVKYEKDLEDLYITGIARMNDVSRITLLGIDNKLVATYEIFKLLSENDINVDIIVQQSLYGDTNTKSNISFSVFTKDANKAIKLLEQNSDKIKVEQIVHLDNLAKISVVGVGMANSPGVASKMFEALSDNGINMHMISTSEIKISVLVSQKKADLAMKVVHDAFIK